MIINSSGATKSDLAEYLSNFQNKLKGVFGDDYTIRKEGVVDNLATADSLLDLLIEDVLMYLIKNQNPYTAEGEWQDNLYKLVGLQRDFSSYTKVTRTIEGTVGTVCTVGSVRFKNNATDDIFELNTAVTIGDNGKAVGSFTALEIGAINLPTDALLTIIDAPVGITGVYYTSDNTITIGDDYEDDSEFRAKWLNTNSVKPTSRTEGGLKVSLLPLVNNDNKDIAIRTNRNEYTYNNLPLHSTEIVLNSAESDTTIANTIFNNLVDGNFVGLSGSTTVVVQDDEGENVTIKFTRASGVPIYFNIEVVLLDGYLLTQLIDLIEQAIINNFAYKMGQRIVANDFYQYINAIEGIDYVTTLEISLNGSTYAQTISMDYNEFGTVLASNITITEA